jgi:hypothetical protein
MGSKPFPDNALTHLLCVSRRMKPKHHPTGSAEWSSLTQAIAKEAPGKTD